MPKNANQFICKLCNFKCSKMSNWNIHISTAKHLKLTNITTTYEKNANAYSCDICNKNYKSRMGLWQHKQKCSIINDYENEITIDTNDNSEIVETMMQLIKQNQEFKELIVEQQQENQKLQSQLIEAVKDSGNTYNNTTNNNQSFNLNFFLNTTCKDAMNMTDFIENMEINFKDIEKHRKEWVC